MNCKPIITPEVRVLAKCLAPRRRFCYNEARQALRSVQDVVAKLEVQEELPFYRSARHEGKFRWVVDLGDKCVMKIPKDSEGAKSNRTEVRAYRSILKTKRRELIDTFVPITAAGRYGEYVVMPKADTHNYVNLPQIHRILKRNHVECADLHVGNVGLYNGKPVILDYGFGVKCTIRHRRRRHG